MPLPVRVDPLGDLAAVPERLALFGNRGVLHDEAGRVVRGWQGRRWIACVTAFRGRRRPVLPPGGYTGLFLRDDASALAAGHRPCMECRRADAEAFLAATGFATVAALDARLHDERLARDARPRDGLAAGRRLHAPPVALPDGAVVLDDGGRPHVVVGDALRAWAFGALGAERPLRSAVRLLTPPTAVAALAAGWRPAHVPFVQR